MKIINKYYDLNNLNKTIVLISDIHYYDKKEIKHLDNVLDRINSINPDYVCISGDITDVAYVKDEDCFVDWLKKLSSKYKVLITLGNHEYYINKNKREFGLNNELLLKLEKIKNLYLLKNQNIIIDDINFIGLDLGIGYYFNKNKVQLDLDKYIDKKYYNVLLCHSPVDIEEIVNDKDIDLVLCGHMHGGIVPRIFRPILKNKGFISPTGELFPKYAYGIKKVGSTTVITTSGIRVISRVNKFYILTSFFSSEVAIISI